MVTPIIMGLLLGGLYALIALGLSLVFGVMKLINLAHGDFVLLSTYIAFVGITELGIDPLISLVISIPVLFVLGFVTQRFLLKRASLISMEAPLIMTFGLSLILQNLYQIIWSPMSRGLQTSYAVSNFSVFGANIPLVYLLDFIAALVVMLLLQAFLRLTYMGKAINAASQDRRAAQLMGINSNNVYAFAFAIAMATAAVAGVFLGLTFPFTPQSGVSFLIIAFGVIIIGGLGNVLGTFIGGIILGLAQTLGGYFFGAAAQMLVVYSVVLVVLAIRPKGIFGR